MPDALTIDQAAVDARKPSAGPLVEPAEAIAIALSVAQWKPGGMVDPDGVIIKTVLKAVHDAGWKFEPR
jgi:hypothetical protein